MKIKKLLAIFLAFVAALSFAACGSSDNPDNPDNPDKPNHSVVDTKEKFYKNGSSEYKIVIPAEASDNVNLAASELNVFLTEAAGVTLPIVKDDSVTYDNSQKYISIGRTSLFEASGIKVNDDELKTSGYILKTIDKTLYITGCNWPYIDYGNINGVYGFLKEMIGLEIYSSDCYDYKSEPELNMKKFDVKDIPDYDSRSFASWRKDTLYSMRLRFRSGYNNALSTVHTQFEFLPKEKYFEEHKDWYNSEGTQLRLINNEMRDAFVEAVKNYLRSKPDASLVYIGITDTFEKFSDADAAETRRLYNTTEAGLNIVFCNYVVEKIEEWLPTEYPGRVVSYTTMAYSSHLEAPVTYNEATGEYVPDSEYVKFHPKLGIEIVFSNLANYWYPLTNEANESSAQLIKKWGSLCNNNIRIYDWDANFRQFQVNFNNISAIGANMRYCKENGASGWHACAFNSSSASSFEELRMYVESKLLWDTSLNYYDLAKDFILHYYGAAGEKVLQYFNENFSHMISQIAESQITQGPFGNLSLAKYWPFEFLARMADILNEGEAMYEPLKETDRKAYDVYVNRIRQQKFSVYYLTLKNYMGYYDKNVALAMIDEMEKTADKNGIIRLDEAGSASEVKNLLNGWRLKLS